MDDALLSKYKVVQQLVKDTMEHLEGIIQAGVTEADIASAANHFMSKNGATTFWYYGVGSLVLVGPRTRLSISGTEYKPSDQAVATIDLVTVDLSPEIDGFWGDYARSYIIHKGMISRVAKRDYPDAVTKLFEDRGASVKLHVALQTIATPDMTYETLYEKMNAIVEQRAFQNLDFKGNLGHSIEKNLGDREYIAPGCTTKLGDKPFTFEPHIGRKNSPWGYKREDIYYFSNGILRIL
jgi:Xaa-Pro aminopeptidase